MEEKDNPESLFESSSLICLPTSQILKTEELGSRPSQHSSPYYKPLSVHSTGVIPIPSTSNGQTNLSHHSNSLSHLLNDAPPAHLGPILSGQPLLHENPQSSPTQSNHGEGAPVVKVTVSGTQPVLPPTSNGVSLATQLCPVGPKERCTPSQAQAMGQQVLSLMLSHENNKLPLPYELQNTFDIFHRCLAVAYGTFFLNLYTKANAPCLLCHGCKSLYPPGQYIHHACPALPPNIVPCRSRMWRRCLVPLVSQDIDKTQQKERWRFVIEKFSHYNMGVVRRNRIPVESEPHILEMPECKRGRFVKSPSDSDGGQNPASDGSGQEYSSNQSNDIAELINENGGGSPLYSSNDGTLLLDEQDNQDDDLEGSCDLYQPQHRDEYSRLQDHPTHKAVEIVEQLVKEIKRLDSELQATRDALQVTEKQLKVLSKSSNLSDQLVQSLMSQERLTIERDKALKRAKEAENRVAILERHINSIQKLQDEVLS